MKKAILLLLALSLVLSLCACGGKEEESPLPEPDNNISSQGAEPGSGSGDEPSETTPEPTPPPIPSVDPQWMYCRGTWVSKPSESIASGMDTYFDNPQNYLYLSPDTRGAIVLGGWYREFLYSADENKIDLKFTDNGEEWSGDIIDGKIYELAPGGGELHYTFIKIEEE